MNENPSLIEISTIGFGHYFSIFQLSDGSLVNVAIWDTAGQERFSSIGKNYYKDADCCLLVYDVTDMSSFEKIQKYYIEEIKKECSKDIKIILLGNKTDLVEKRTIDIEKGWSLAKENNSIYKETSGVRNENVADAFETLIEITYRDKISINSEKREINRTSVKLSNEYSNVNEKNVQKTSCC